MREGEGGRLTPRARQHTLTKEAIFPCKGEVAEGEIETEDDEDKTDSLKVTEIKERGGSRLTTPLTKGAIFPRVR